MPPVVRTPSKLSRKGLQEASRIKKSITGKSPFNVSTSSAVTSSAPSRSSTSVTTSSTVRVSSSVSTSSPSTSLTTHTKKAIECLSSIKTAESTLESQKVLTKILVGYLLAMYIFPKTVSIIFFQNLPIADQQKIYDFLTVESEKLQNLKKTIELDKKQEAMRDDNNNSANNPEEREKLEKIATQREYETDMMEKQYLLQAIIEESSASGHPLPPSLIKLLHSNNSK